MRTIIFAFLLFTELGLLVLAVANVQPTNLMTPGPVLATPATAAPFGTPQPMVRPTAPPDSECPADNVRKQSCEPRYVSAT